MSKFKVDDHVRPITPGVHFDKIGRVIGINAGLRFPVDVAFNDGEQMPYQEAELTLADPDVHTVLDQMDAESAAKDPELYSGPVSATVYPTDQMPWAQKRKQILDSADAPCLTAEQWESAIEPDPVNHPQHYGGDTTYEVIKVAEAWGLDKDAYLFNVLKYVARAGKKGDVLEDLEKGDFYLNRRIATMKAAQ